MTFRDLATGESGDIETEQAWLDEIEKMYRIFCQKHHDYGSANIGITGIRGVIVRMADKMSRLVELLDKQAMNESIEDSLLDLADYGIIGLVVLRGKWRMCTPKDAWKF